MTSSEDEILEVMRESLPQLGAQCDALTGDGLLARPMHESASPLETVLRVLEVEVLNKIGIPVSLAGKTLRGDPAKDWPTSLSARAKTRQWAHSSRSRTSVVNQEKGIERTQTT